MDYLQEGIHLRSYAQRDPLTEYQREAFMMFDELTGSIQEDFVKYIYRVELVRQDQPPAPAARGKLPGRVDKPATPNRRSATRSRATPPAPAGAARSTRSATVPRLSRRLHSNDMSEHTERLRAISERVEAARGFL
jgi:preprotein translocase subunit SecA